MERYDFKTVEKKWQDAWRASGIYRAVDGAPKKFYALIEFPYPSGDGLHVGHVRSYTALDTLARKRRMEGWNVLYPIGWDAFGLPTENYAVKTGVHPAEVTKQNTDTFRRQLQSLGFSFDWDREVNTTDPAYYRWTQWIFVQLFKKGLAYKAKTTINWCPSCKIGLANEEVVGGKCERCGTAVEERLKEQWMLRITAYAEKLLAGLGTVDFLPRIKDQQVHWIGKSEGASIDFEIAGSTAPTYVLLHGYTGSPNANFFPWLKGELERRGAKVYAPALPDTDDPKVADQVAAVLKDIPFDEHTVVVGHSLGGSVALKILERLKKPVQRVVVVASACENRFLDENFPEYAFDWRFDWDAIRAHAKEIRVLRDTTDPLVPQDNTGKLAAQLGIAPTDFAAEEGHACGEKEPEVLRQCLDTIKVFTTRPDTLFGATFMVVSPELARSWVEKGWQAGEAVRIYIDEAIARRKVEGELVEKEKTGVDSGIRAINPATKEEIPVWISDYVLSGYGTGAIMAVPAHDERDFEFAKKFGLSVRVVISDGVMRAPLGDVFAGEGKLVNSGAFDGMDSEAAKWAITEAVGGKRETQYHLRDWVFSRQRYWGEPIPMVHCGKCGWAPVPESELPVVLPDIKEFKPREDGESPLASVETWVHTTCPSCGGPARRETDVMPNWAGSSWYFLRYTDPKNDRALADPEKLRYWMPVDWYNGGMEHTTLHLLYSRFWNLFLHDIGAVPTPEPYAKRTSHGMILGAGGVKMSKSRGNVVNPDEVVAKYGADALRLYELFIGPFDQAIPWDDRGIEGTRRFIDRVWGIVSSGRVVSDAENTSLIKAAHRLVEKAGRDIETMGYNTAVAAMMVFLNACEEAPAVPRTAWELFIKVLAPFAPHLAEELWHKLGHESSVHAEAWPEYNPALLMDETVTVVVQVNGKPRATVTAPRGADQAAVEALARAEANVARHLAGGQVRKTIFVEDRLINFVL